MDGAIQNVGNLARSGWSRTTLMDWAATMSTIWKSAARSFHRPSATYRPILFSFDSSHQLTPFLGILGKGPLMRLPSEQFAGAATHPYDPQADFPRPEKCCRSYYRQFEDVRDFVHELKLILPGAKRGRHEVLTASHARHPCQNSVASHSVTVTRERQLVILETVVVLSTFLANAQATLPWRRRQAPWHSRLDCKYEYPEFARGNSRQARHRLIGNGRRSAWGQDYKAA